MRLSLWALLALCVCCARAQNAWPATVALHYAPHVDQRASQDAPPQPGLVDARLPLSAGPAWVRPHVAGPRATLAEWFAPPPEAPAVTLPTDARRGLVVERPALDTGLGLAAVHVRMSLRVEEGCALWADRAPPEAWLFVDGALALDAGGGQRHQSFALSSEDMLRLTADTSGLALLDGFFACRDGGAAECALLMDTNCTVLEVAEVSPSEVVAPLPAYAEPAGSAATCPGAARRSADGGCVCGATQCGPRCGQTQCTGGGAPGPDCACAPGYTGPLCGQCTPDAACLYRNDDWLPAALTDEQIDVAVRSRQAPLDATQIVRPRQFSALDCDCRRRAPAAPEPRPANYSARIVSADWTPLGTAWPALRDRAPEPACVFGVDLDPVRRLLLSLQAENARTLDPARAPRDPLGGGSVVLFLGAGALLLAALYVHMLVFFVPSENMPPLFMSLRRRARQLLRLK